VIALSDKYLISVGTNRACYSNPDNKLLCIKINIGDNKETHREIKYYMFLKKKNISWEMLSKYYGSINTNLGKGEMFELIRDYNGNISKQLNYYLKSNEDKECLLNMLLKLKSYLLEEMIIVKDLNAANIVYQKYTQSSGRLVIIDGLNNKRRLLNTKQRTIKTINKIWSSFFISVKPYLKD
jgi:hypothetical protein